MNIEGNIVFKKKTLIWIAGVIGVSIVLLARDKAAEVLLFLIGVTSGIFIGKQLFSSPDKPTEEG